MDKHEKEIYDLALRLMPTAEKQAKKIKTKRYIAVPFLYKMGLCKLIYDAEADRFIEIEYQKLEMKGIKNKTIEL